MAQKWPKRKIFTVIGQKPHGENPPDIYPWTHTLRTFDPWDRNSPGKIPPIQIPLKDFSIVKA